MEKKYSFVIGLKKSIKNVAVTVGIPMLVLIIDNYTQWMPDSWEPIAVPIIAIISYLVKNKMSFGK